MYEVQENESSSTTQFENDQENITKTKSKQRFNITKADIGLPFKFQHVSHVGWDHNIGFNIKCDDPDLNRFFGNETQNNSQEVTTQQSSTETDDIQESIHKSVRKSQSAPSSPNLQRQRTSDNTQINTFLKNAGASKNQPYYVSNQDTPIKKKAKWKGKITKSDIGKPSQFRHVTHVGWSGNGFDFECNDPFLSSENETKEENEEPIRSLSAPASLVITRPLSLNTASEESSTTKKHQLSSKTDIGFPFNFRHISHITWDPETGFNIDCDDPDLRAFLKLSGVTDKQLQDKETREFIFKFINRHGGYQAIQEEVKQSTEVVSLIPVEVTTAKNDTAEVTN